MSRWVFAWSLILLLSGCSDIRNVYYQFKVQSLLMTNQDINSDWIGQEDKVVITPRYSGEHMLLPVSINGHDGFELLLDIGNPFIFELVDSEKLAKIQLTELFSFDHLVNWQSSFSATAVAVDSVQLGPVTTSDLKALKIDGVGRWNLFDSRELRFDGVIGVHWLKQFGFKVEPDKGRFTLVKSASQLSKQDFSKLAFEQSQFGMTINAQLKQTELNDVDVQLGWSTGALSGELMLFTANSIDVETPEDTLASFPAGSFFAGEVGRLNSLILGGFELKRPLAWVFREQVSVGANGFLSAKAINRFDVIYDFGQSEIWLKPNPRFALPSVFDQSGIVVNKLNNAGFIVYRIEEDSPAAQLPIKQGDIITHINGVDAQQIKLQDYESIMFYQRSASITINNNQTYTLVLKPRI